MFIAILQVLSDAHVKKQRHTRSNLCMVESRVQMINNAITERLRRSTRVLLNGIRNCRKRLLVKRR